MDAATRSLITKRANDHCEYCHLEQTSMPLVRFHIEHIRAVQHGGSDSIDNLCLACPSCNSSKGPNQSAYDPETGTLMRLFNPRLDTWEAHFRVEDGFIIGETPLGRATIELLKMNSDRLIRLRQLSGEESEWMDR